MKMKTYLLAPHAVSKKEILQNVKAALFQQKGIVLYTVKLQKGKTFAHEMWKKQWLVQCHLWEILIGKIGRMTFF